MVTIILLVSFNLKLKSFDGTIISQVTNAATAVRQFDSSNSSNQNRYPARSDASTVKQQQQHRHQLPYQQHPSSAAGAGTLTQHTTRSTQRYESKAPASTGPGACNTQSRSSPQSGASNLTIVCKVYVQNIGWGTQVGLLTNKFFFFFFFFFCFVLLFSISRSENSRIDKVIFQYRIVGRR